MIRLLNCIILIGYSLLLAYWMLFAFGRTVGTSYMYNLVPFQTIREFLNFNDFNRNTWVINLLGNIGVFIPFGLLIPLVFKWLYAKSLGLFVCCIVLLELAQLVLKRGSFDVDDIILNSFGLTLGYGVLKIINLYLYSRRVGIR